NAAFFIVHQNVGPLSKPQPYLDAKKYNQKENGLQPSNDCTVDNSSGNKTIKKNIIDNDNKLFI
ncbi:unnamed protein product, partial [Rotaria socialis]